MLDVTERFGKGFALGEDIRNAPRRNALADLALQSRQQSLANNNQLMNQRQTQFEQTNTDFDQQQAVRRAQILSRTVDALKTVPQQNRPQVLQQALPELQQFGVDLGDVSQIKYDDQSLNNYQASLSGLISNPQLEFDKLKANQQSQSLDLRKQQLALEQQREQRQSGKLSAGLEKELLRSQDATVAAQRSSSEFDILADQVSAADFEGGIVSSTTETLAKLLGTQDDVTELRRRFNAVRLGEGLKNLPPGPATDRDVQEAFKGVPPENAPASQVVSFLRGAAKMARFDAGYNQFKSDYISENSTAKGINKEWRKSVPSSVLGRNVTIAEIYAEAAAEGITPEEVKEELGIEE